MLFLAQRKGEMFMALFFPSDWPKFACLNGLTLCQQGLMLLHFPGVAVCSLQSLQLLPVFFLLFPSVGSQLGKLWVLGSGRLVPIPIYSYAAIFFLNKPFAAVKCQSSGGQ